MPVRINRELPAFGQLTKENIFVMSEERAVSQDIRPLKLAILNIMPTKIVTETQLLRLLGEHLQVITQAVAVEKGLDLGKRVVQPPQIPDRGQRIDLVEVVKAAVVFAVAHLRHQQALGVIMAQQLDIHVENVGKLPDGQKFFHKKPPIFPGYNSRIL